MTTQDKKTDALPLLLLVEDSPTNMALLTRYLSSSCRLLHANDGKQAWDALEKNPEIELVITDINMPNMSGHQLLKKIRNSNGGHYANLLVIVMTTPEDRTDRKLALENGADDFITKPVDEMELLTRVNVHCRLARTIHDLEAIQATMAELAHTDTLTRLRNRRAFFERGGRALMMARDDMSDLSVILLDIDHFKQLNDSHGHQAGDEALIAVGRILKELTREVDTVARLGKEEFALLLPNANRLGTAVLAERIRAAVEREPFIFNSKAAPITVSIGIASFGSDPGEDIDQLLGVAGNRLYLAKKNGRNRICVNDEGKATFA
jgi:diguanylate cyclase (GGDEF)-like protein